MFLKRGREEIEGLIEKLLQVFEVNFQKIIQQFQQLKEVFSTQEANLSQLERKIERKIEGVLAQVLEKIEDLEKKLEEEKEKSQQRRVFLLVDGDYALHRLFNLARRLYWPNLLDQIRENYGEISAILFYAAFVPPTLSIFLKRVGFSIIDTSLALGEKGLTDETILSHLEKVFPRNSVLFLFTGDRNLKHQASLIAKERQFQIHFLDFDPEYPHSVKDREGKIEVFLSFPSSSQKEETHPNVWKETLGKFLEGRLVDPERDEKDRLFLAAIRYLFYLLPSTPRIQGEVCIPRGFLQLASDLYSFFHALERFSSFSLSLTESDAIGILEALLEAGFLKKAKVRNQELIYRAHHREWGKLKEWLPKSLEE